MNRRNFLQTAAGAAAAGTALSASAAAATPNSRFRVVHFTDTHIFKQLRADEGVASCFRQIAKLKPDLCLSGGDLVFDALEVKKSEAKGLFDLYGEAVKRLDCPVHTCPGNHDLFGVFEKSGVATSDPEYGTKMFEDRIGPRYKSLDHKGWHFVTLNTVGIEGRGYVGLVDEAQLNWLKEDLAKNGASKPVVVMCHIPLVTAAQHLVPGWKGGSPDGLVVRNSADVVKVLEKYPVKMVLQGHTHINERVAWKGIEFITTGAVCGNWWKGTRLGFPEGYAVLEFQGSNVTWRYENYGWKSPAEKA